MKFLTSTILAASLALSGAAHSSGAWSELASGFSDIGINLGGHGSKGYGNISLNSGSSHTSSSGYATGIYAPATVVAAPVYVEPVYAAPVYAAPVVVYPSGYASGYYWGRHGALRDHQYRRAYRGYGGYGRDLYKGHGYGHRKH